MRTKPAPGFAFSKRFAMAIPVSWLWMLLETFSGRRSAFRFARITCSPLAR